MSERWRDIVTTNGGQRLMVRWRTDVEWPDPARPTRINFAVTVQETDADGLPTPDEVAELDRLEDAVEAVYTERGAVLAMVVTTGEQREWVAYAADADWVEAWAAEFAAGFLEDRGHLAGTSSEPGWDTYAMFAGQMPKQGIMRRRWTPKGWWRQR